MPRLKTALFMFILLTIQTSSAGVPTVNSRVFGRLPDNGVSKIVRGTNCLWMAGGKGLVRYNLIHNLTSQYFDLFDDIEGIAGYSIYAIYVAGDTVLVSALTDTFIVALDDMVHWGKGFALTFDNGATWKYIEQPGETGGATAVYDFTMMNGVIYGASWYGGLIRSSDWGETWQHTAPDSATFDPNASLNHLPFSVLNADGVLWVGTALGVNKSLDGGVTWTNYNVENQLQPIAGNWVIALKHQKTETRDVIWAVTWKTMGDLGRFGVSKTENAGQTWDVVLPGEKALDIAVEGANVYVATEYNGLFKSADYGDTWYQFPPVQDQAGGEGLYTHYYRTIYVEDGVLWAATADGLARTDNNGFSWTIFRAFQDTGENGEPRTYAYPNPFSYTRDNVLDNDGHVRFQYNTLDETLVTVRVYDFAMELVATVCENKFRSGPGDYNEGWNGKNDYSDNVANGVYFYSVQLENDGVYWGKVLIVN